MTWLSFYSRRAAVTAAVLMGGCVLVTPTSSTISTVFFRPFPKYTSMETLRIFPGIFYIWPIKNTNRLMKIWPPSSERLFASLLPT